MIRPVFLKLGGSVLTDKQAPESLALAVLQDVATTIARVRRKHPALPLLIGHGGGSFGHYWAERYATHQGIRGPESWQGVVKVADAMGRLNRAVVAALLAVELPAISLQPMASARAHGGELVEIASAPIATLLHNGLIPVIYGDVVLDDLQGCAVISTEALFASLVQPLQPSRIVLVGETAVFESDPRANPASQPIPRIDRHNYAQVVQAVGASHGIDVTGGMRAKVESMWRLATSGSGVEIVICGPDQAQAALLGQPLSHGTVFVP